MKSVSSCTLYTKRRWYSNEDYITLVASAKFVIEHALISLKTLFFRGSKLISNVIFKARVNSIDLTENNSSLR